MLREELKILYVGAKLPSLSETFVYREIFELLGRGVRVSAASVHQPESDLGEQRLAGLARQAIPIYGQGAVALLSDAMSFALRHPGRAARTAAMGLADAICGRGVPWRRRHKLPVQCLAGLALARRCQTRRLGINWIHAHMAHVPTSVAMYAAHALGVPFSFTGHAADLFRDNALLPAKLKRAQFVSCISHWHREFYRKIRPSLDEARLPIVRCGVDTGFYKPHPPNRQDRPLSLLSVGRLVEKKGFDTLVRACAKIKRDGPEFTCTIVGDGPESDQLKQLVRNAKLESTVFLPGSKSNPESKV